VKPIVIDPKKELVVRNSAGLLQPLRVPAFRNLLIADLVSDVGTFMQSVGAAWLMVSLHAGPGYVALIQTAASLPYFLLALPAGSAGDIFDRRRLILFTEVWMMGVALILAVLTIGGLTSQASSCSFPVRFLRCCLRWPEAWMRGRLGMGCYSDALGQVRSVERFSCR